MHARTSCLLLALLAAPLALGCSPVDVAAGGADASLPDASVVSLVHDGGPVIIPLDALAADADVIPEAGAFCALGGSIISTALGDYIMPDEDGSTPDASPMPDLTWLTVPVGFCVHYFGNIPHNRQLRFAPDGDLFGASPSTGTAGGSVDVPANGGILVLPDDNHDGLADSADMFIPVASVQGMTFANGNFYFQNGTNIETIPFAPGERTLPASLADASDFPVFFPLGPAQVLQDSGHWPKNIDIAQDGTFYVTNGSQQSQECLSTNPVWGSIWKASGSDPTPSEVAKGFRNPIAIRCEPNHDVCLAVELSLDGSGDQGGREKIVPVRQGDDWGFPCCATQYTPFTGTEYQDTGVVVTPADCANVSAENVSFEIGHTPFGIDYETGRWPAPWTNRAFLPLHGDVGTWYGARIVAIALDPDTGLPLPASELDAAATGDNLLTFGAGWDDGIQDHGRPTTIAFAPDGRMFIGNDWNGDVVWIAPVNLPAVWPEQVP
jgi:glucose/arabinose dehydrogenase